jgi:hypothetical protein
MTAIQFTGAGASGSRGARAGSKTRRGTSRAGAGFGGKPLTKAQRARQRARRAIAGTEQGARQARGLARAQVGVMKKIQAARRRGDMGGVRKAMRTYRALGAMIADLTGGTVNIR